MFPLKRFHSIVMAENTSAEMRSAETAQPAARFAFFRFSFAFRTRSRVSSLLSVRAASCAALSCRSFACRFASAS